MIYMCAYVVYVLPFHHSIIFFSVATAREQPSSAVGNGYDEAESCKYIKILLFLVAVTYDIGSNHR